MGGGKDAWLFEQIRDWVMVTHMPHDDGEAIPLQTVQRVAAAVLSLPKDELVRRIEAEWLRFVSSEMHLQVKETDAADLPLPKKLSDEERAAQRSEARQRARARLEARRKPEHGVWARHIVQHFSEVSGARYKLVPGRVPEVSFWSCLLILVERALLLRLQRDPFLALQAQALRFATSTQLAIANAAAGGVAGAQGQAGALWDRPESPLQAAAVALWRAVSQRQRVVLLTGYPCVASAEAPTPQKLDGPCAAALLLRAALALEPPVQPAHECARVVVEQANSPPLKACLGVLLEHLTPRLAGGGGSLGSISEETIYGHDGRLCVEALVAGPAFAAAQQEGLEELARRLEADAATRSGGLLLAVERAGPARRGAYCTEGGAEMDARHIAPIHRLSERLCAAVPGPRLSSLAVFAAGATKVGAGAAELRETIATRVPLGQDNVCTLTCDQMVLGHSATLAALALACALALQALPAGDDADLDRVLGTEAELRRALEAGIAAGAWDDADGVQLPRARTVNGVDFDDIVAAFNEMRHITIDGLKRKQFQDL